jgi:hypothetical protein
MIPGLYSQGKNVFPIVPYRAMLQVSTFTAGGSGNEVEVLDLDLQFESNEVMDVIAVQTIFEWNLAASLAVDSDLTAMMALCEDPDKTTTTDLYTEATFEDDNSFIHFEESGIYYDFVTTTNAGEIIMPNETRYMVFPQPYVIARNLAVFLGGEGVEGEATSIVARVTVWGRRRNANDAEFKNIIYRQRF